MARKRKPAPRSSAGGKKAKQGERRYRLDAPDVRARAEALAAAMEAAERKQIEALENADRLTEEDMSIVINLRPGDDDYLL